MEIFLYVMVAIMDLVSIEVDVTGVMTVSVHRIEVMINVQ
jgi:hypothetical protein